MSLWEPPTMKSVLQLDGNPLVDCSCGRSVNADMMRVLNGGYACDACLETMFRTGSLSREEFAVSQGAPATVLEKALLLDEAVAARAEETAARQTTVTI